MRIIVYILFLSLLACSDADTLGDQPPREITVTDATFAGDIGSLLELKCAYCHAYPLPDLAPNNIVTDLDLTTHATRLQDGRVIRGADAIGRWIKDGILDHPVAAYADSREFPPGLIDARQMPLDYGTPVTDAEKQSLLTWAQAGAPLDHTPLPGGGDADAGASFWGSCNFCHGLRGEGLTYENRWLGPPLTAEALSLSKIQSMWLWSRASDPDLTTLSDEDAINLRAFILTRIQP